MLNQTSVETGASGRADSTSAFAGVSAIRGAEAAMAAPAVAQYGQKWEALLAEESSAQR